MPVIQTTLTYADSSNRSHEWAGWVIASLENADPIEDSDKDRLAAVIFHDAAEHNPVLGCNGHTNELAAFGAILHTRFNLGYVMERDLEADYSNMIEALTNRIEWGEGDLYTVTNELYPNQPIAIDPWVAEVTNGIFEDLFNGYYNKFSKRQNRMIRKRMQKWMTIGYLDALERFPSYDPFYDVKEAILEGLEVSTREISDYAGELFDGAILDLSIDTDTNETSLTWQADQKDEYIADMEQWDDEEEEDDLEDCD
jgi:hypothetical protein